MCGGLIGRDLDPQIDISLLWFCRPHGVKVQGQRFLVHVLASDSSMILIPAHENMHPPIDLKGPTFKACLDVLERDPLLARILREKSSDTGYNYRLGLPHRRNRGANHDNAMWAPGSSTHSDLTTSRRSWNITPAHESSPTARHD